MNRMKWMILGTGLIFTLSASAQDTIPSRKTTESPFSVSGYLEGYYNYDFNKPTDNNRPSFIYSHNRHNEFNVNLGFLKGAYNSDRVRANLAVGVGTYMNANYAAEPGVLKNIFEANAGVKLSKQKNLWLDIGILPSHIGFESAIGKDNWTLTRSMVADNSPYFESGARLSYTTDNAKWQFAALALNGWQRITRVAGNSLMSWGTQVSYKPSSSITFNYSTFIGTDKPDSARTWRVYHNLYAILPITEKIGLTAGFDIGSEQQRKGDSKYNTWYTPVGILRYTPSEKWAIALRGEYFSDEKGILVSGGSFQTTGLSANFDYTPFANSLLRLEIKNYHSREKIFSDHQGDPSRDNTAVTFALAVWF